jgi:voltage-gated potassium channel
MQPWREKIHEIIFEADTRAGKLFDILLLVFILLSLVVVMLDSVVPIHNQYLTELFAIEWFFTIIFSVEYILRIIAVKKTWKYIFSFYGIIDFVSTVPTYLTLVVPGGVHFLQIFRVLRFLRLFKIFKLGRFTTEARYLGQALKASREKIIVFVIAMLCMAMILGSLMYIVEGKTNGFTSIPRSIYWAVVTLTTVGFGDISPVTPLGQFLSTIIMIMGYGIIAVPTGIVTAGVIKKNNYNNTKSCSNCAKSEHSDDAFFCNNCGNKL